MEEGKEWRPKSTVVGRVCRAFGFMYQDKGQPGDMGSVYRGPTLPSLLLCVHGISRHSFLITYSFLWLYDFLVNSICLSGFEAIHRTTVK